MQFHQEIKSLEDDEKRQVQHEAGPSDCDSVSEMHPEYSLTPHENKTKCLKDPRDSCRDLVTIML